MNNDNTESCQATGKFKTADELLSAYNALQSEFTKRCQSLKRLQAELDDLRAQADTARTAATERNGAPCAADDDKAQNDAVQASVERGSERCDAPCELAVPDDILRHADEYAEILSAIPEVMNACIARYKKKLLDARTGFLSPSGAAVITPVARPKTLSDAKRLADDLLK